MTPSLPGKCIAIGYIEDHDCGSWPVPPASGVPLARRLVISAGPSLLHISPL